MVDHIAGIESMLDTTYYLAKKNKAKSSIMFDEHIYDAVQRCVLLDIDISDRYVLGCSPDLLPEYTLSATIGLNSDDYNGKSRHLIYNVRDILSSRRHSIYCIDVLKMFAKITKITFYLECRPFVYDRA